MTGPPVGLTSDPGLQAGVEPEPEVLRVGHGRPFRGCRICPITICWIVDDLKRWPCAAENESSRFGPIVPLVPAAARVWQLPQFLAKS